MHKLYNLMYQISNETFHIATLFHIWLSKMIHPNLNEESHPVYALMFFFFSFFTKLQIQNMGLCCYLNWLWSLLAIIVGVTAANFFSRKKRDLRGRHVLVSQRLFIYIASCLGGYMKLCNMMLYLNYRYFSLYCSFVAFCLFCMFWATLSFFLFYFHIFPNQNKLQRVALLVGYIALLLFWVI